MKNKIKISLYSIIVLLITGSCDINEYPGSIFLSPDNLYSNIEGANTALNGVYKSLHGAGINTFGMRFPLVVTGSSGLFGYGIKSDQGTVGSLSPLPSWGEINTLWLGLYGTIGGANDLIEGFSKIELPDAVEQNNILGQAYFIRAFCFFNLVSVWGGVPLVTGRVTSENLNFPRSSALDVYEQIISDANRAKELLYDVSAQDVGRPGKQAANMLLAKVYTALAGNQTASETAYWEKAWNEAIEVYQHYNLVTDYRKLWYESTGSNTTEGIFEFQIDGVNTPAVQFKIFTAPTGTKGKNTWGRLYINLEVYDSHVSKYPGDPRISSTFVTSYKTYWDVNKPGTKTTYPTFTQRGDYTRSYPFLFKWFAKDGEVGAVNAGQNNIIYRYADLLLMLAEIENELRGPGDAYQYVNQVLQRARKSVSPDASQPADWNGMDQESFREAIMAEYTYELLGEGQEWFNVRRRGYDYFKTHVIDVHNNHPKYDFSKDYDNRYPENERIMLLPIPSNEIDSNPNITQADQNPGW